MNTPAGENSDRGDPKPLRVLIAEDEFLVSLALEDDLRADGHKVIGPIATVARATEAARTEEIDVAVLDINMGGEMAFSVADALRERGVPFLFLSGYGASAVPELYRNAPRISKPYDPALLLKEIRRVAGK